MVERYDIIRHAELVHGDIAVAAVEKEIDRVTAAKAADELLTLSGIHASVVLYKHGTGVNLSARSLGEINVQFIMEKLGGRRQFDHRGRPGKRRHRGRGARASARRHRRIYGRVTLFPTT